MGSRATSGGAGDARPERRLLLLFSTTGYEAGDFVAAAENLGVACVFGSDRCHVMKDPWQDGALPLHFEDPEGSARMILESARTTPVHAIVAVGDRPTVTAALASRALGLPHNPPEAAEAARNKFLARQRLRAAGLPVPPFARFRIDQEPRDAAHQVPFPCVLKPLALSASRGVIRADNPDEFVVAFRRIAGLLRTPEIRVLREEAHDWILVEGFIEGGEVALEGLLDRGRLRPLALFDKPDPLDGPYFEETIYVTPSRLERGVQEQMLRTTEQAARAFGLVHGPIHAELRVSRAGPRVLEVAARSIGGLCSRVLRFGTGISLEELIIRHALGMDIGAFHRESSAAGVMMIPIPHAGIYRGVEGLEEARRVPGVGEVTVSAKEGQRIVPLPEGSSYLGFIFARGSSPEEVEDALRAAHKPLRFEIVPSLNVPPSHSSSEPAPAAD
ncbi:MAG: ATP-grasp domain-containing protein [candidate division NC10 bacterium]|nr:ATP-grasp domain-containing protein [candidate division NC10 bacterium]